jgi:flagellar biosynthesis protein FlhF
MDTAMNLRKFQARSMHEALARVKRELGRDAIILHTRTLRRGGMLGIGVKTWVEITATVDQRVNAIRQSASEVKMEPLVGSFRAGPPQTAAPVVEARAAVSDPPAEAVDPRVLREIREIREMVLAIASTTRRKLPRVPAQLVQFYSRLIQQQVSDDLALQIVDRVSQRLGANNPDGATETGWTADMIQAELLKCIAEMVPVGEPLDLSDGGGNGDGIRHPKVVALVGPTGVGKTTTLAKLAANLKLRENKKVGLITIDTFRIAAVEQLKTYAEIMELPLVTVSTVDGIGPALESMAELDVVLIDTAGRSQRDEPKISELSEYLQAASPSQIHLVLSSTSQTQSNREAIEKLSALGAKNIIFTKLDEAVGFGAMLGALANAQLKLSYLTHGQSVPDDIEPASGQRLARLVLGVREETVAS